MNGLLQRVLFTLTGSGIDGKLDRLIMKTNRTAVFHVVLLP